MSFIKSSPSKTASPSLDLTQLRVRPVVDKTCLSKFDCGDWGINSQASKLHKWHSNNRARAFSAHDGDAAWGLGFYSLSVTVEDKAKMGTSEAQVYDFGVPLIYIEALGVRLPYQGQGMGKLLLMNALERSHSVSQNVPIYGVALRSLNERTTDFYKSHGFGIIEEEKAKHPLMVIPIWTLQDLFGNQD